MHVLLSIVLGSGAFVLGAGPPSCPKGQVRDAGQCVPLHKALERERREARRVAIRPGKRRTGGYGRSCYVSRECEDKGRCRARDLACATIVKFTDVGQTYSTINGIDCLEWPSERIRRRAGSSGWGSYEPANGDIGEVLADSKHCSSNVNVLIVRVRGKYVPIGESGVKRLRPFGK